ncbi:hypothetical protein [Aquimarina mytili]|uniref:DUF4352 domain-containing protein n=1 Tax=Aquimarina mytili TaxID=874423 RepID=A0A936ZWU5_9FLAO|nr:hypothetical protein [Aquimarina mytili]MBL0682501.1 hypothetical protein [Aquimarina mytili]
MKTNFLLLSLIILMNSCATGYVNINPKNQNYASSDEQNNVKIEYKYNVLKKKYAKKELKKNINVVAIKVTNNSDKDITFGNSMIITNNQGSKINMLENDEIFKPLKQNVATYFLYLLLTPINLFTTKTNEFGQQETTSSIPIGLVIGPGVTAINTITAGSANKKFKEEIKLHNLKGKTIKKGETVAGIIGIRSNNYNNLKISLK